MSDIFLNVLLISPILFQMIDKGMTETMKSVIREITGHSTSEMFDRYNTVDDEDTQKAMNMLKVFFENGHQG
jgi:hypothetical protein